MKTAHKNCNSETDVYLKYSERAEMVGKYKY